MIGIVDILTMIIVKFKRKINCNVVIANIGDMFINDQNNYILMSTPRLLETMYVIKNNGIIYEENNLKDFE